MSGRELAQPGVLVGREYTEGLARLRQHFVALEIHLILEVGEGNAEYLQAARDVGIARDGVWLVVVIGVDRRHFELRGESRYLFARLAANDHQRASLAAQGVVEFDQAFADEFDAAIHARQGIENLGVEDEGAEHFGVIAQGVIQRGVVEIAQVAAEPDKGTRAGRSHRLHCAASGPGHAQIQRWRAVAGGSAGLHNPGYNMQVQNVNLTHHFLIAMPAMEDPDFTRSLVYVAEHNDEGALGVVINRPIDLTVEGLFERVDIPFDIKSLADEPIYFGGPVQTDRGFVLHRPIGEWQSSLKVNGDIALTSSKDILQALGSSGDPAEVLITLGYSGWGAGQLEEELAQNAWLTVPADAQIIFALPPDERLTAAMQLLGVDFTNLSDVAGHA